MKPRVVLIVVLALIGVSLLSGVAVAGPAGFTQSISHAITGSSDGVLSSYVMKLIVFNTSGDNGGNTLYVGDACRSDWNDIAITDQTGNIKYPHWINWDESGSNFIVLYYNITTGVNLGGTNIIVWYSYPGAINSENPYGVFKLFDDFNTGVLNSTTWGNNGAFSISNGAITITANNSITRMIRSVKVFSVNTEFVVKLKTAHWQSSAYGEYINYLIGGNNQMYAFYCFNGLQGMYYQVDANGSSSAPIAGWSANTWHVQRMIRDGVNARDIMIVDDGSATIVAGHFWTAAAVFDISASGTGSSITCDYIYAMPYTSNPPQDGIWGIGSSDILQVTSWTLYKLDVIGLSVGPVTGAAVSVYDVNGNLFKTGTTGNDGSIAIQLYKSTYYNITFIKGDIVKYWYGYPNNPNGYMIYIYPWEFIWRPGGQGPDTEYRTIVSYLTAQLNGTNQNNGDITVYYNDTSGQTTTTTIDIYKRLNMTSDQLVATYTTASNNINHLFTINSVTGKDYKVVITAQNTHYGTITRTYTWTFPGIRYSIPGLPAMAYVWIAFLVPALVALTVSQRNLKFGPIVFCAMSWGFTTIGWMAQLGTGYILILAVSTFFAAVFVFAQKAREGGY
jgi:hypothetical protein